MIFGPYFGGVNSITRFTGCSENQKNFKNGKNSCGDAVPQRRCVQIGKWRTANRLVLQNIDDLGLANSEIALPEVVDQEKQIEFVNEHCLKINV